MQRTLLLIFTFLFSLSLITLAYSQSDLEQTLNTAVVNDAADPGCAVGHQGSATVPASSLKGGVPPDHCSAYSAYIQGACCCDLNTGQLNCPSNPVCSSALQSQP